MFTTTQLDNGILNNYAVEPQVYYAGSPAPYQIRRYLLKGAIAIVFVTSLVILSAMIS
ncbi:MAG: ssl1498 family light-harvesting-like protein [Crocosphaera sp.]